MDPLFTTLAAGAVGLGGVAVGSVSDFAKRVFGPLADEIGHDLAHRYREYRVRNVGKAVLEAERLLSEAGGVPHEVPPRLLLPILEGASLEAEPALADKWAALLANAAADGGATVRPIYVSILGQLSPDDALILSVLEELAAIPKNSPDDWGVPYVDVMAELPPPLLDGAYVSFNVLVSLGLVAQEPPVRILSDGDAAATDSSGIDLTSLGRDFLAACRPPTPDDRET